MLTAALFQRGDTTTMDPAKKPAVLIHLVRGIFRKAELVPIGAELELPENEARELIASGKAEYGPAPKKPAAPPPADKK